MPFTGYLREEDEHPVDGDDWLFNPCMSLCLGDKSSMVLDFHTCDHGQSNGKRIDMAAVINEHAAPFCEFECVSRDKVLDATNVDSGTLQTREEWSASGSDDLKSEEELKERAIIFGRFSFSPCVFRVYFTAFSLLGLFITGLGVGLAARDKSSQEYALSASAGSQDNSSGGGAVATPAPDPHAQLDGPSETLDPTSLDLIFDIDYEDMAPEDDITGDQQWETTNSPYLVGAYYYSWHGKQTLESHSRHGSNFHNGDGYMRRDLVPEQQPTLGEYDDTRSETIAQHLRWSRQANIGLWITSWWGPGRFEDSTTKDVILQHEDLGDIMISLHYETSNRVRNGLTGINADMDYMCENYFDHPNYYKIDGRPVLFVYVTRKLDEEGILAPTILTMRTSASKCGYDVYLVGDQVFESAPDEAEPFIPFWYFDAVTNYDVYGSMGRPSPYAGSDVVDTYYSQQDKWRTSAHASGCNFIPAVSPGYNDRGVRPENNHPPLSRQLTENSSPGSLFAYQLIKAKSLVDPQVDNLLVVNSFNEWHEDTQIEPASGERTNLPLNLTEGVYYEGYGELYLNLLREGTI